MFVLKIALVWKYEVALPSNNPLQSSCLENPMDRGAWWAAVHGVAKSRTRLSDFPFTFHFHALEKEMATHSSVIAWRIPGTGEPGGLPSMGSHRVRHDWSNLAAAAADVPVVHYLRSFTILFKCLLTILFKDANISSFCFPFWSFLSYSIIFTVAVITFNVVKFIYLSLTRL